MQIIVGLGNPGLKYAKTRHNIGFMVVDHLADQLGIKINKLKHRALVGEGRIGSEKVLLVKPQTFMNLSGESLREIVEYYQVDLSEVIVIYDDVDIDFETIRIRQKGSGGTHNGMRSIIKCLGKSDFPRVRMGIGSNDTIPIADYVIGKFSKDEQKRLSDFVPRGADAVVSLIKDGVNQAMNKYNGNS